MLRKIKSQSHKVTKSQVVKDLLLCLLSGALLILSFPRFNIGILAWFGFLPLFFVLRNKSKFKAFLFSYLAGVIFWFGIIYWLVHVTLPGMIILALYLALYFGLFGLVFTSIKYQVSSIGFLFLPAIWVLLEYLRSYLFTGFPWALLGYSQYLNLPVIQIADITGVWGVSFLVMMANVALYSILDSGSLILAKRKKYIFPVLFLLVVSAYGYYQLYRVSSIKDQGSIRISVIQGNILQELKWDPASQEYIIDKYLTISRKASQDKPDLIIWPEASLPVVLEEDPVFIERVKQLAQEIKIPILLGAVNTQDDRYYNSALLISSEGKISTKYDKLHLVPFGEYIPFRNNLRFFETIVPIGDFTAGREYTVFTCDTRHQTPDTRQGLDPRHFSVLICFEDLFPGLSREFSKKGADFLVNITNDAWFKKTSSPYQHLQASVFRAVENRLPLIRAANTGVSGFILPTGKTISLVQDQTGKSIFVDGFVTREIALRQRNPSFYTRYGDVFVAVCLIFILLILRRFATVRAQRRI